MRTDPLRERLDLVERRAERRPPVPLIGAWALGPRVLPPPVHVSPPLRDILARTPTPDIQQAQARAPGDAEDWRRRVATEVEAGNKVLPLMAAQLGVTVTPDLIAGVRVYRVEPQRVAPEHADHLFVYVHGGAFIKGGGIAGSVEAVVMAAAMGIRAVAIDYRMAPDHSAPAAMDDVVAVWRALAAERDPSRMILGGTSAGANLTLVATLRLKELGQRLPGALFVGTPPVDFAKATDTRFINEGVDRYLITWDADPAGALALYRGSLPETDWRISPIYGDVTGFPPTYLIAGTRDMMLSDTALMHRHLRRAGVVADLHVYEGQSHGDYVILASTPEGIEHQRELKAFILRHLAR
jgi:acetyl esterase/lipase